MQASAGSPVPVLLAAASTQIQPYISPMERLVLERADAAGAPTGALFGLRLRADPVAASASVGHWIQDHAPALLDDALVELCYVGPTRRLTVDRDLLLAYFSPAFRWAYLGMAEEPLDPDRRFDGPASLLEALGNRLWDDPSRLDLKTPTKVVSIADGLESITSNLGGVGEMRQLFEFCDDFVAPHYNLKAACLRGLHDLRECFRSAADADNGLRILA